MTLVEPAPALADDGGAPPAARPRRPRRDRLALPLGWLVVAAACAVLARVTVRSGLNTDVFWQLAAGKWMLSHHAIIRSDVFSYTVHGRPWLAEEWGFEVLLAWMVDHLGPVAYWLVSGGACIGALLVGVARWRRQGASVLWTAVLAVLATGSLVLGLAPRPQDLSYLLFALELLLLTLARRRRAFLLALPPLFALWCNLHGSFLAGLAVLGLEVLLSCCARIGRRRNPRPSPGGPAQATSWRFGVRQPLRPVEVGSALVASLVATLLNPHGWKLLAYVVRVTAASRLAVIQEWESPDFHSPLVLFAIAVPVLVVLVVLAAGRVRTELFDLIVWIGFLVATLHAIRFAPYLGIATGGLAASWEVLRRETLRPSLLTVPASVALCFLLLSGGYTPPGRVQSSEAPVAAASYLLRRSGRVFSSYSWNDYLISKGIPVFTDGRTDLYFGTGILKTYLAVTSLTVPPDRALRRFDVRYVLWPARSGLSTYLANDRNWRLVRRFRVGEVFERLPAR